MTRNFKKKDKKRKKDSKKKEKMNRSNWKELSEVEEKNKYGEAKIILPSPYENERIILRKKQVEREGDKEAIEINAVREDAEGVKEVVGKKVLKQGKPDLSKKGENPYELTCIKVRKDYQKSRIGTSMSELARKIVEEESGGKKPLYEATLSEEGKKYFKGRGIDKGKFREGVGKKAFLPEEARKEGLYIKQGKEERAVDPERAVEKIKEKGKSKITNMIAEGEIQRKNYKEIIDKLKEEKKTVEAKKLKEEMEDIKF